MCGSTRSKPTGFGGAEGFCSYPGNENDPNDYVSVKIYRVSGSGVLSHLLVLVRMRDRSDRERTVSDSVLVLLKDGSPSETTTAPAIPER